MIDACAVEGERQTFIIDGTTLTTSPTEDGWPLASRFDRSGRRGLRHVWSGVELRSGGSVSRIPIKQSATQTADEASRTVAEPLPNRCGKTQSVPGESFSEVLPECDTEKLLHVLTTLDMTRKQAIALYLKRYDVEHDIRDVKVTLNTERIRARSREMFEKE